MMEIQTNSEPKTLQRVGFIHQSGTYLGVWEEDVDERAMLNVLRGVLGHLNSRGWQLERDPDCVKNYPSIAHYHWVGRKGDLQLVASTGGRALEMEFFQEIERGADPNPHGGRYDYDKFGRMPPRIRLLFCVETAAVIRKLRTYGYKMRPRDAAAEARARSMAHAVMLNAVGLKPADDPLEYFNSRWCSEHMGKRMPRFERDETGWPTLKEYGIHPIADRDGLRVRTGEIRYFRGDDGRLRRGVVYPNMNGSWMVVHGGSVSWVQSRQLFFCGRHDIEPRRVVPGQSKRLLKELNKAIEAQNGARVAVLGRLLDRIGWPEAARKPA